jgi:hypothetical protein
MKKKLLQEGDVIELKEGHKVYADIPEKYYYDNRRNSNKLTHADVEIGGIHNHLAGKYIVYKTSQDGGGTGHGPNDVYPNGHHVFAEDINGNGLKVDFYQTGSFTAMITDISPIAKAKRQWVIDGPALD